MCQLIKREERREGERKGERREDRAIDTIYRKAEALEYKRALGDLV